jgi:hypothetical protein
MNTHPILLAVVLFFFWPVGLFLLWIHPRFGRSKAWWWIGGVWSFFMFIGWMNKKPKSDDPPQVASAPVTQAPAPVEQSPSPDNHVNSEVKAKNSVSSQFSLETLKGRAMLVEAERLRNSGQREEADNKYAEFTKEYTGSYLFGHYSDEEKEAFGPYLSKYFAQNVRKFLNEPASSQNPSRLKFAEEEVQLAKKRGITIPDELIKQVEETRNYVDGAQQRKGDKYKAFKRVVENVKDMPDRFAGQTTRTGYNRRLGIVIGEFDAIPYNVYIQEDECKWIIELYESDIQNKYNGKLLNDLDALVRKMNSELISR